MVKPYPYHGWVLSDGGQRELMLPILDLTRSADAYRQARAAGPLPSGGWRRVVPFFQTVTKLASTLRELHWYVRAVSQLPDVTLGNQDVLDLGPKVQELAPLYLDLAYVYCVRLANFLAAALRPVLFRDYGGKDSNSFKKFRQAILDGTAAGRWQPLCDMQLLQAAFTNHTSWFDLLQGKGDSSQAKKGIRDVMEHREVFLVSGFQGGEGLAPALTVHFNSKAADVDSSVELVSTLRGIIAEMCELWTGICQASTWRTSYLPEHRLQMPSGDDDDWTGFWPAI